MSEFYEGVVVAGDQELISSCFHSLDLQRATRLIRFEEQIFGVYPRASRSERMDLVETLAAASQLSKICGQALAVMYDNRIGLRTSQLFRYGEVDCEFGEQDERWVPLDECGNLDFSQGTLGVDELEEDEEYECNQDAIALGLAALGVGSCITSGDLKQTFCYDGGEVIAER